MPETGLAGINQAVPYSSAISVRSKRSCVSDDDAFSESPFRTFNYRAEYPSKPFASIEDARDWVALSLTDTTDRQQPIHTFSE